jgi:hypothetical protein
MPRSSVPTDGLGHVGMIGDELRPRKGLREPKERRAGSVSPGGRRPSSTGVAEILCVAPLYYKRPLGAAGIVFHAFRHEIPAPLGVARHLLAQPSQF